MKKFKVIAQQTPFKFNSPIVLVIDAEGETQTFIESYKQLTKLGYNIISDLIQDEADKLKVCKQIVNDSLPKEFTTTNMVHILNIQVIPY